MPDGEGGRFGPRSKHRGAGKARASERFFTAFASGEDVGRLAKVSRELGSWIRASHHLSPKARRVLMKRLDEVQ